MVRSGRPLSGANLSHRQGSPSAAARNYLRA